jgi:hypothetical protein
MTIRHIEILSIHSKQVDFVGESKRSLAVLR